MIYRKIEIGEAALCLVSEDCAKEFVDHRVNKKSPLTQRSFDRAMKNAVKCQQFGITANEAVELVIDKGWTGITVEYVGNELQRRRNETGQGYSQQNQTRSDRADAQLFGVIGKGQRGH